MSISRKSSKSYSEIEKRHQTVAESFGNGLEAELLTVRLGEFWSDLIRVADDRPASGSTRSPSAVPLLDDMKGIAQWD
jgi:hypothetical protein